QVFTAPPDVLHPGQGARILEPIVGKNSVLLLDEDAHMSQRKLMLPAFHGKKMAALDGLMTEVAEREVASWPGGEPIALHPRMQRLTLEIILRAAFGLDPGPRLDALRDALAEMLKFGEQPIGLVPLPTEGPVADALSKIPPLARFDRMQAVADELIFEQIAERRAEGDQDRDDVLAMLLAARHEDGSPMSDQELRDELMTLLVAGHETTASSLAWAFNMLPRNPEVLATLTDEVRSGDGDEYVTATIHETLRARPVLPNAQPRFTVKPITVGGFDYPEGVCLVPNAYLVHHDAEVYDDPYTFRPERFLDEGPGTYTWIPFGGGRRRCLGASFAMAEMKLVLQTVLSTHDVRADGAVEGPRRHNITIRPAGGARTVLGAREREPAAA
ncbi:MAG TPA: cytochrome P450, partial [Thermoleophilaceae bacterium]|nr:cytochrome P450 [Thermoleophilaceae bacterium]